MQQFDDISLEEQIAQNGELITCSMGTSMYPMLRNRKDMVVLKAITEPIRVNDVILVRARSGGKLVMHRVIKITDKHYVTRGDNCTVKEYAPKRLPFAILKAFYRGGKFVDCEKSRGYKLYVFFTRACYPIRWVWYTFKAIIKGGRTQ